MSYYYCKKITYNLTYAALFLPKKEDQIVLSSSEKYKSMSLINETENKNKEIQT